MSTSLNYRPDIDGLRAVAVLSVVLFHLEAALIPGGFVGVDVFFVISGYLITRIICREVDAGRFSYAAFYERRIRRLMPALLVMLLVTSIPAWLMLLPGDYKLFAETQGLSAIFLTNVHFWNKTDYFNDAVANIPLLHTWSLAVEEQFYLFFPPLLLFLLRVLPSRTGLALCGLALLSLLGAEHALSRTPESAFYLTHLRAWELLAGALLATGLLAPLRRQWLRETLAAAGLLLVVGSVFLLDKQSRFPGMAALPAVVGSALIIYAGETGTSLVGRLLSLRLLVFFGLISYSLYLWHWPLFAFVGYYFIEPLSPLQQVVLFLAACLLGWLSWRFVENRFRHPGPAVSHARVFRFAGLSGLLLILLALPGVLSEGARWRFSTPVLASYDISEERIPFHKPCFGLKPEDLDVPDAVCGMGASGAPEFLLWGDSHGLALAHGVDLAGKSAGVPGVFLGRSTCPPVLGSREFRASNTSCRAFNDRVVEYLRAHPSIRHVILSGYWSYYLTAESSSETPAVADGFEAGLERALQVLVERGVAITLVDQVPGSAWHVPSVLARSRYFDRPVGLDLPIFEHQARMQPFRSLLQRLGGRYTFDVISLDGLFCGQSDCVATADGQPLYRDVHHLSRWGSEQAAGLLRDSLSKLPARTPGP